MADDVIAAGAQVKIRHPWGAWLLSIITLGIYGLVWWYKINRELRDYSAGKGQPFENDPALSLLALFPGGLIIVPPFVTNWTTPSRVARAQTMSGSTYTVNPVISLLLWLFVFSTHIVYLQYALNSLWRAASDEVVVVD